MKILYIPHNYYRHETNPELFTDLVNALGGEIYKSSLQAREYKPDVILFHGSLGPDDSPFTEDTPISPMNPYAVTKASSDMLVQAFVNTYKINACIT